MEGCVTMIRPLFALLLAALSASAGWSGITVPGATGADGPLSVTVNTVIDLSLAPTAAWDAAPTSPGRGVYDPAKWAVVYKYSSVNVASGATLTFKNNLSYAPVVWLVNGDVTINGTVSLNGSLYGATTSEPGPGGFHGGPAGAGGLGPGGANAATTASASYGTKGAGGGSASGDPYGNPQLLPLVGGSGSSNRGSGGGGAILIAATGTITVNGAITANAQRGWYVGNDGSGGAIRLAADTIAGTGQLRALGNAYGGDGRIRLEPNTTAAPSLSVDPSPSAGRPATPVLLWPPDDAPSARIVSVGGELVPADARSQFGAAADVLPDTATATIPVIIATRKVATDSVVHLRIASLNGPPTTVTAIFQSGNMSAATWRADVVPTIGTSAMVVRVEAPDL